MKYTIYHYPLVDRGSLEQSWYGDVWTSDALLKMQVIGMPYDAVFHMDKKAIPQLINILQRIQHDQQSSL